KLVQEAGAQGATVSMLQSVGAPYEQLSVAIQQALGVIGLDAQLTPATSAQVRPMWQTGNYDAAVKSITGRIEPANTMNLSYLGVDNLGTPPSELVDMAGKALVMPLGSKERDKAYQNISKYLQDNPIHIPILDSVLTYGVTSRVVGEENLMTPAGTWSFRGVGLTTR